MIRIAAPAALAVLALLAAPGTAQALEGDWITDADAALEAARKANRPVLAVAMDHA